MRGTKTRALRAVAPLIATLIFFLESDCARAQARAEPEAPPAQAQAPAWRVAASYGQASAPRSQGFAEAWTLGVARDFALGAGFAWGIEVTPLALVSVTRVDLPGRPRESRAAMAVAPTLAWDAFPRAPAGIRLEAGVGVLWAFAPVPAEGSRFNFVEFAGARFRVRLTERAALSAGVRRSHVSNFEVVGPDNPGLSFYAGVLALDLAR